MKREAIQCAPLALIVGGLVWGVVASNAQADTIDWDGNNAVPPSGYYNVAANWNPDKIPGAADNARFINNPYAYDVFFDKSQEVWDLAFQDPMTSFLSYGSKRHYAMNDDAWIMAGWLNLIGLDFTVTDNMRIDAATMTIQDGDYGSCSVTLNDLEVAYEDVGVLLVYGGDITSNSLWISYEFGSAGTVLIDGSDTTWTVNGPVEGGFIEGGSASLTISNGAELSCTGSTFSGVSDTGVTVDGPGTTWDIAGELNMGVYYRGNLTITDGAAVTSQTAKIGLYWVPIYSGWGVVDVGGSGADASWTNTGSVYVAGRDAVGGGHGELNLKTGSLVNIGGTLKVWGTGTAHTEGSVTMCSGSTLIADVIDLDTGADFYTGTDSRLCVNGLTGFGDSCTFLSTLEIGHAGGSGSGSLTIGDGQYCTVEDDLTVGLDAPGEVLVCEGGNLTNDACKVGQEVDAIGTVTVEDSGAQWYNDQWVIAGVNGHGTIDIVSGGYVYSHEVSIGYGAGSVGVANVKWYGSTWTCLGNFYVGRNGQGTLSILGGKVEDVNGRMGWGGVRHRSCHGQRRPGGVDSLR